MAMNTERSSKALHNFTMPCDLRWGNQRFLRCMKVNSDGQISPLNRFTATTTDSHSSHRRRHHSISIHHGRTVTRDRDKDKDMDMDRRESSSDGSHKVGSTQPLPADHGIAAIREKVMFDLQTAADKMKDAIFKEGLEEGEVSVSPTPQAVLELPQGESHRPWSLRTRRAAGKATSLSGFVSGRNNGGGGVTGSDGGVGKGLGVDVGKPSSGFSPMRSAAAGDKSPRLRSGGGPAVGVEKRERERGKFSVALSKRAIEEDFFTMVNHRPPRRPKKRAKIIQKQLDTLFPGLWLTEVTPDMYKVTEPAP